MLSQKKTVISLILNLLIVVVTIGVVISYFCGNDGEYHIPPSFRFNLFTTDSNILCALTALILAFFEVRFLRTGKAVPTIATSLYMHFAGPLIGMISFCFVETIHPVSKKMLLPAVIPTAIYGIVYIIMVILIGSERGGWIDFYGFNMGGFWYLSGMAIVLLTLALAAVMRLIHNKCVRAAAG